MNIDVAVSVARGVRAPWRVAMPAALLLLVLLPVLGLQGCGQKGPLTLPPADNAASAPKR